MDDFLEADPVRELHRVLRRWLVRRAPPDRALRVSRMSCCDASNTGGARARSANRVVLRRVTEPAQALIGLGAEHRPNSAGVTEATLASTLTISSMDARPAATRWIATPIVPPSCAAVPRAPAIARSCARGFLALPRFLGAAVGFANASASSPVERRRRDVRRRRGRLCELSAEHASSRRVAEAGRSYSRIARWS